MITYWLNFIVLIGTAIIASVAIFSTEYDDNFLQRLGLSIIAITFYGRAVDLIDGHSQYGWEPIFLWKNIGIFLFALGTFLKFTLRHYARTGKYFSFRHFPFGRRVADKKVNHEEHITS